VIENAHQNNLKNLDLKLPHGELIVITGVSGSGKSTLAFDTVYAEGQRRYVETFSPYARQFLDRIEGIPPAIAIDQTNPVRTSRSTVGTMTELNDHIKLLFARMAKLYCGDCGKPVLRDSPENISNHFFDARALAENEGQRLMITFRVDIPENFSADEIQDWLARQGYTRVHAQNKKNLDVIQDRIRASVENRGRFVEAIEAALRYGQGKVTVHRLNADRESVSHESFSVALQCEDCGTRFRDPVPSSFSFNSPIGACDECRGFGRIIGIDYRLAIPDGSKSLNEGAVKVFQTETNRICQREMTAAAKKQKVPLDKPFDALSKKHQRWVFDWLESKSYRMHVRVMLAKYRSYDECPSCKGARLKPSSLMWRVGSLKDASTVIEPAARYRHANPARAEYR